MAKTTADILFQVKDDYSKDDFFTRLCGVLCEMDVITSKTEIQNKLLEREKVADTRISEACAMPHCMSESVIQSKIIFVDCSEYPILWHDVDNPVEQIIVLLLAKDNSASELEKVQTFVRELAFHDYDVDKNVMQKKAYIL